MSVVLRPEKGCASLPIDPVVVMAGRAWSQVLLPAVLYAEPVIAVSPWVGLACSLGGGALLLAAPWAVRVVSFLDTELAARPPTSCSADAWPR